jgi:monoamine oxidase
VLVAGAGLAGLVAARELTRRGAHVNVIESRDRPGGRILTLRAPFADGQYAEAGGELIDEDQQALIDLVEDVGLSLVRVLEGGWSAYRTRADGSHGRVGSVERAWQRLGRLLEHDVALFHAAEKRLDSRVATSLASESVAGWLARIKAPSDVHGIAESLAGFFLASPEDLSLLSLVELAAEDERPGQGRMFRILGGNDRLCDALAARLPGCLHLRSSLEAVILRRGGVTVTFADRGRRTEIRTDYLVSTLPTSTLRHVSFTPPLPDAQRRAIETLTYGPATKFMLQFDRRFWRGRGRPSAFATNLDIGAVWDASDGHRGRSGILMLLAGGRVSARAQARARRGIGGILAQLQWLGAGTASLIGHARVSWEADPWAQGGYAYFSPAYDPTLRSWLARPFERIFFAGEHTSLRWQGYMNGAVESGMRVAAEIEAAERWKK